MMFSPKSKRGLPVSAAIVAAFSAFALQSAFSQAVDEPASSSDDVVVMEKYEVVGSHIKRLEGETPNPVLSLNAATLGDMGFPSLGDAIRALPFNSGQALSPTDSGTSFTPGVNSFNLRGLGNNATLVLINGRRAVPYASPGFDGFQTVFDLNSIPDDAIESIDILKDGGSAIYGSDAVAGVVDIRLKKGYVGAQASLQVGNYFNTGGLLRKASVAFGSAGEKTNIFASFSWETQASVFARDLVYSADADNTAIAPADYGHYEVNEGGVAAAGYSSLDAYLADVGLTTPTADGMWDQRSSRGFPGYLNIPGVGRRTFASPTDNPTTAGATSAVNYYNYQVTNGLFPETQRFNIFTTVDHKITDHLRAFAELSFSRSEATVYSAATPVDIETSHGLNSGDQLTYPAYNPYNPWGVASSNGRRRLVELPNRISDVTSDTPRFLVGLQGDLDAAGLPLQDWTWDVGLMYSKNTVLNLSRNAVPDYAMQEAFNGLTRLGDGSLTWDPTTPQADRVYFNWFGVNEPAFADFLAVINPNSATIEYRGIDFSLGGPIMDLPGGQLAVALGGEHRREDWENIKSDLNATGNILGGSEGTSSMGHRDLTAFYMEFSVPVHKMLEIQLAGRYEEYSDKGFAKQARPKVAFKFHPVDWLIFRGSFAKSFKAPDLAYLYTAAQTSFTSNQLIDPVTGMQIDQLQIVTAGNTELKPELTDTYYAGVAVEGQGRLKGLSASVDYFNFKQTNLLARLSDFYGYSDFLTQNFQGNPLFAGKVIRDSGTNEVLYIRDDYANISTAEYKGFDFDVAYTWTHESMGRFRVDVAATYIDSYKLDDSEQVGGYLTAAWNGNLSVNWSRKDWQASVLGIYRGPGRTRSLSFGNIFTDEDELFLVYEVPSQLTWNTSVTYNGFKNTQIMVGVNNLFNSDPPFDGFNQNGFTPGVNDGAPGFWYMKITRNF